MTAYLPAGRTIKKIKVPVAPGVWVSRSTGTRDPGTVRRMQEMIAELGAREARAWDLLSHLTFQRTAEHPDAWTLMDLYERYQRAGGDVARMRRAQTDVSLEALIEQFLKHVSAQRSTDTANHYAVYLDTLEAAGITRVSQLDVRQLSAWLDGLADGDGEEQPSRSSSTRRKYAAGVSAFCSWLVRRGDLTANPMRDVPKPSRGARRMQFLDEGQMVQLVNAMRSPYRELSALIHGTGLDVSVACERIEVGQIDQSSWSLLSVRPKTGRRHTVVIAEWARPFVRELVRGKFPRSLLGEGVTRWALADEHRLACQVLGIENYWLRDARHSWAVRFAKLGGTAAQGAEQLGHADGGVLFLELYSRHAQSIKERLEIEDRAVRERGA